MNIHDPESWAELLLDIGKKNKLIHARGGRGGQVSVVSPAAPILLEQAEQGGGFAVAYRMPEPDTAQPREQTCKKGRCITVDAPSRKPEETLQAIAKKARLLIEETGVNAAYMTFGEIVWCDPDDKQTHYAAPMLLLPVSVTRRSAAEEYTVTPEDDTPVANPAFAYKLFSEYHIVLPEYTHEGLEAYRASVEELVAPLGWHTEECAWVGIFSFHKENMYRDLLENRERLLLHPNVQSLMGGVRDLRDGVPSDADFVHAPLHLINDADACQTKAVEWAQSGKSFVLQGPPGSGKSQTIANILAQAMCDGKKVLFVSEKLAALKVVYEKMERAGLGDFCMELHSHRSKKKQFIDKLCRAIKMTPEESDPEEVRVREDRGCAEERLNAYTNELHKMRQGVEKSLFELLSAVEAEHDTPDCKEKTEGLSNSTDEERRQTEERLVEFALLTERLGEDWRKSPWRFYTGIDPSYGVGVQLRDDLETAAEVLQGLVALSKQIPPSVRPFCGNVERAEHLLAVCRWIERCEAIVPALLEHAVMLATVERVMQLRSLADDLKNLRDLLGASYREAVFFWLDAADQRAFLKSMAQKRLRAFNRRYRALAARVRGERLDAARPNFDEMVQLFDRLTLYHTRMREFEKVEKSVKALLGDRVGGLEYDWAALVQELSYAAGPITALSADGCTVLDLGVLLTDREMLQKTLRGLSACLQKGGERFARLCKSFRGDCFDLKKTSADTALAALRECLQSFSQFDGRCHFNRLCQALKAKREMPFVEAAIAQGIPPEMLAAAYRKAFYRRWIDRILGGPDRFTRFSGVGLTCTAERFAALDKRLQEFDRAYVKRRLLSRRGDAATGRDAAMLLREGEKKRRQKNIRALLCDHGDTVARLTPCFFMSPLSVGTFLGEGSPRFDTVIFDEASQIFPQDALGAILRADQMIVVGDSKQMPPENFFESNVGEDFEAEGEQASDYESILDLASAAFPVCVLKWHYRSRSETLIAFSNRLFYGGELVTVPSAKRDGKGLGIELHRVDGIFEHGKRVNSKEAEKTVELILRHAKEYPDRSLGVVAFSTAQQELIERLLFAARRKDRSAEAFFDPDRPEPFFIKNLETVQGDERDTVIFSVAYARDASGKLIQNFGPINREGGERRINVAVTRAKYHVHLVTSILSADILPPKETGGVAALRDYLAYAEQNDVSHASQKNAASQATEGIADAAFETSLCRFLEQNGFRVEQRVGNSRYPVELAVIDPKSGDYAVAIETDGKGYRDLGTARDRDRLRPSALERMGWRHLRVWSVDFLGGNGYGKEALLEALQNLLAADGAESDA